MKKCELKVAKFKYGEKVYEEVLGKVMVFEGRISAKVYAKYFNLAHKKIKLGRQERLAFYLNDKEVYYPEPFVDFAYIEK